ncbi:S-adenosyl-L-methionine-dependent methyltransferase [Melanomma pulvis-pyrius CBS 109.77]|uniref:S-adenosyl-L-methionine-dependent methyltransferase n=1 Tax=Melanomma pulvis-pyrius CBS 109.77 TaxID=1314802 RepID=A0A6A6X3K4_9PLEO|nr:S-adenosyl-L-methionine-dependent methyltransferase [Melanomma pulvis-pyrius CBS 109.77]
MSLYYEAAAVLANTDKTGGSLKSRIYRQKDLKSSPAQLFALITEASKWSAVLKDVIEKCGLLAEEKKLTPILALLLAHDLLSKNGVAAPATHVLKLAITRHKARLSAEFTKARLRAGYATLEAFKQAVNTGGLDAGQEESQPVVRHPRWVRVNTLKTTVAEQLSTTLAGYEKSADLSPILTAPGSSKVYFLDPNIPNLIALPSKVDLTKSAAYLGGQIIFQDKASCFPAYLLNMTPEDGDVIDGCAAPGNKTTHLAAIISEQRSESELEREQKVIAFERDKVRTSTLSKMVKLASADTLVSVKGGQDFLAAQPDSDRYKHVGAILLDPSCSGSGIVGRDDAIKMHLPDPQAGEKVKAGRGKKRKRDQKASSVPESSTTLSLEMEDSVPEETASDDKLSERLTALSAFQLRILVHAMRFPKARKITYSTCSIHFEENEGVVFQALASAVAQERGWRTLKKEHQVEGLKTWKNRGVWEDDKLGEEIDVIDEQKGDVLDACIRCDKGTEDGTMGFFVAAFVRDEAFVQSDLYSRLQADAQAAKEGSNEEEEWNGFSDEDTIHATSTAPTNAKAESGQREKKKRRGNHNKTS